MKKQSIGAWEKQEFADLVGFCRSKRGYLLEKVEQSLERDKVVYKNNMFLNASAYVKTRSSKQCKEKYHRDEVRILGLIGIPAALIDRYKRIKKRKIGGGLSRQVKQKKEDQLFSLACIVVPNVIDSRIQDPDSLSHAALLNKLSLLLNDSNQYN